MLGCSVRCWFASTQSRREHSLEIVNSSSLVQGPKCLPKKPRTPARSQAVKQVQSCGALRSPCTSQLRQRQARFERCTWITSRSPDVLMEKCVRVSSVAIVLFFSFWCLVLSKAPFQSRHGLLPKLLQRRGELAPRQRHRQPCSSWFGVVSHLVEGTCCRRQGLRNSSGFTSETSCGGSLLCLSKEMQHPDDSPQISRLCSGGSFHYQSIRGGLKIIHCIPRLRT